MSFLAPLRLVLLVLPVALVVAYVVAQRRRDAVARRFSSQALLGSVAPARRGWARHLAPALMALALVAVVVALAQPTVEMRTPKERATVMLTLDTSVSMIAPDVPPTRLGAAQVAARSFVEQLPDGVQVGLVTFDKTAALRVPPTTDRAALTAAIDALETGSGTATPAGIRLALETLRGLPPGDSGQPAPAAIVLMSDGTPTIGLDGLSPVEATDAAVQAARDAGVPIDTIAFGTAHSTIVVKGQEIPVSNDPEIMARIAEQTNGRTFSAETAGELASVYEQIGRDVAYDTRTVELTVVFVGAAIVLAALAAAAALLGGGAAGQRGSAAVVRASTWRSAPASDR